MSKTKRLWELKTDDCDIFVFIRVKNEDQIYISTVKQYPKYYYRKSQTCLRIVNAFDDLKPDGVL